MPKNRTEEVLARADSIIGDFISDGGYLNEEQANTFIDEIQEQPTILNECRVEPMASHTKNIDAIGFDQRILRAARNSYTDPTAGEDEGNANERILTKAERSAVAQRQVQLISKEIIAEVHLHQEVLEDNIERAGLEARIMRLITERVSLDLEEWILRADTLSGDPYLALTDGALKRAVTNVVDNMGAGITPNMFRDAQLAMPQRYMTNVAALRTYVTTADDIRYRSNVAARATGYGDSALQSNGELVAFGVPVRKAMLMPASTALFTFPQNIIFGIHRRIQIETERLKRARTLAIIVSMRVDMNYEDERAVVKIVNIN